MQRVGIIEVTLIVVSPLRAKLTSTDRGQASEVIGDNCSFQIQLMVRNKNVGGGPRDEDLRRPPRLPTDPKGKATKKLQQRRTSIQMLI